MPDVTIEELQAEFNVLRGRCERAKLNRANLLQQAEAELAEEHRAEGAASVLKALIERLMLREKRNEVAPPREGGGAAKGGEGTAAAGATDRRARRSRKA